jgi:hypothetical protein
VSAILGTTLLHVIVILTIVSLNLLLWIALLLGVHQVIVCAVICQITAGLLNILGHPCLVRPAGEKLVVPELEEFAWPLFLVPEPAVHPVDVLVEAVLIGYARFGAICLELDIWRQNEPSLKTYQRLGIKVIIDDLQ